MIEITEETLGEGRNQATTLKWLYQGKEVVLRFLSKTRYIYVEERNEVFASEGLKRKIYRYRLDGTLLGDYTIPDMNGYQYRGINRNPHSKLGISLLFFPLDDKFGNEWQDIEQYDFVPALNPIGDFIDIYR